MRYRTLLVGLALTSAMLVAGCTDGGPSPKPTAGSTASDTVPPEYEAAAGVALNVVDDIEQQLGVPLQVNAGGVPGGQFGHGVSYNYSSSATVGQDLRVAVDYQGIPADYWPRQIKAGEVVEASGLEGVIDASDPEYPFVVVSRTVGGTMYVLKIVLFGWPEDSLKKALAIGAKRLSEI